jgi:hypothetical protein
MSQYLGVIHHVAGRLRIKLPALRGNVEAAHSAAAELQTLGGVRSCLANPVTGSLLIQYDGVHVVEVVFDRLKGLGHDIRAHRAAPADASSVSPVWADAGRKVGKIALTIAAEKLLERSAVALVAALI